MKDCLFIHPEEFFQNMVEEAMSERKMNTFGSAKNYLVKLLQNYINTDNFFDEKNESGKKTRTTLAELYLKAHSSEPLTRIELLKKLGDISLYVSGLFGPSLQRKIIDVDYYGDMGATAYGTLAESVQEEGSRVVFREYSCRFGEFMDVLNCISMQVFGDNKDNLLRLYERYIITGSESAKDALIDQGVLNFDLDKDKIAQ